MGMGIGDGDWGLGVGDWGWGIGANPPTPVYNPQYPNPLLECFLKN